MKSKHDLGCGARRSDSCDCRQGRDRRILRRATKRFKRQREHIAEQTGLHYDETLIERSLGVDWYYRAADDCQVGRFAFDEFC